MGSTHARDVLTVMEAARELGLSRRAIQNRITAGTIRAEQVNPRLWLVPRSEVERLRGIGKLKPGPRPKHGQQPAHPPDHHSDDGTSQLPAAPQHIERGPDGRH